MDSNSQQYKTLGSVGGMAASASAGGFSAGPVIAGQGGVRGDSSSGLCGSPKAGGNVMVGGHFGPTASAAPAASGYAQGDQFAATGGASDAGSGPKGGLKAGGNVLNGGNPAAAASGYNQGDMFAGKKK